MSYFIDLSSSSLSLFSWWSWSSSLELASLNSPTRCSSFFCGQNYYVEHNYQHNINDTLARTVYINCEHINYYVLLTELLCFSLVSNNLEEKIIQRSVTQLSALITVATKIHVHVCTFVLWRRWTRQMGDDCQQNPTQNKQLWIYNQIIISVSDW